MLEDSSPNEMLVLTLYEALNTQDGDKVQKLLAPDLEWWFHGPPSHQFMMRLLTGSSTSFKFMPQSMASFGSMVLVEGCDHASSTSWVHAWTVNDGIITQVREYFNTSLTVTRLGSSTDQSSSSRLSTSSSSSSSSSLSSSPINPSFSPVNIGSVALQNCTSVWESSLSDRVGKSVPGLVLFL